MLKQKNIKRYSELIRIPTFEERVEYLRLYGTVGSETFGYDRIFNQMFYQHSKEWKAVRNEIILRDSNYIMGEVCCCDLGCTDREIVGRILIHHMNPLTIDDIRDSTDNLLNPEYLIATSFDTHNLIHFGFSKPMATSIERKPNDTCLWKRSTT